MGHCRGFRVQLTMHRTVKRTEQRKRSSSELLHAQVVGSLAFNSYSNCI